MKHILKKIVATLSAMALVAASAFAQTMPQDNWRYDGTNFGSPTAGNGLACIGAGSGGIYIGEIVSGSSSPTKILRFSENGIFISRFSATFTRLLGITCDSAGNVYVFDRGDSKVKVFSESGTFLREWGGAGTADGKFTVANNVTTTNIMAISRENEVFVCDPGNSRVQVFDLSGAFLRKFGELGALPGQFTAGLPLNIAIVGAQQIIFNGGKVFDKNGNYKQTLNGIDVPRAAGADGSWVAMHIGRSVSNGGPHIELYRSNMDLSSYNFQYPSAFKDLPPGTSGVLFPGGVYYYFYLNGDCAFAKNGNFYVVISGKCYRNIREYAPAMNFTNSTPLPQAEIISSSQRVGTNLVDIGYRVTDTDSPSVSTALLAFINGNDDLRNVVPMRTFLEGTSGNVGQNQPVDTVRNVVWNMAADWAVTFANIRIEALAKDARNLRAVHWITIPASGGNPALQVSHSPLNESDYYHLWLWFIGNNQVTLTRNTSNATVHGNGGIYDKILFASHTTSQSTTSLGKDYALSKMGARRITAAELTRAQAGSYGFASLSSESIVKEAVDPATSAIQGYGNNGDNRAAFQTFTSNNPVSIDAGMSHNLFIRADGSLWGYGSNSFGELGLGDTTARSVPTKIADGVAKASAGSNMSAFIKTDGTLWVMGRNVYGGLGDGTTNQRNSPVQITTGVAEVSVGMLQTLFVKTDGTLWSAGRNNHGQLGDGTTTDRLAPVSITSGVTKVVAAGDFSFFIKTDGSLWATGRNDFGQLGRGNNTATLSPVQVASGVLAIEGSSEDEGFHSHMIKTDGSLWATGRNHNGQLGDRTTTNRNSFVPVTTDVDKVVAGQYFSMFRKTNGTIWAHGLNSNGQLADGTTTNRTAPVQISSNVIDFSAGREHSVLVVPAAP